MEQQLKDWRRDWEIAPSQLHTSLSLALLCQCGLVDPLPQGLDVRNLPAFVERFCGKIDLDALQVAMGQLTLAEACETRVEWRLTLREMLGEVVSFADQQNAIESNPLVACMIVASETRVPQVASALGVDLRALDDRRSVARLIRDLSNGWKSSFYTPEFWIEYERAAARWDAGKLTLEDVVIVELARPRLIAERSEPSTQCHREHLCMVSLALAVLGPAALLHHDDQPYVGCALLTSLCVLVVVMLSYAWKAWAYCPPNEPVHHRAGQLWARLVLAGATVLVAIDVAREWRTEWGVSAASVVLLSTTTLGLVAWFYPERLTNPN